MFLIKEKRKHGTNLCIVQSYRDPDTKTSKTKRIMNVGYLEDLQKQYDDPIAHFQKVAKEMTENQRTETKPIHITCDPAKSLEPGVDLIKNFGYTALSSIYHELKLDVFFRGRQRSLNINYSLNSVMKLLVYGRILFPGSEKQIFKKKKQFFDKMDFELDDVYQSFTYLHRYKAQLQTWIHQQICENYERDTSQMYYYVTNHYFEISEQERLKKNDTSKEQRPDPIVQMGLFVDKKGLPVSYELFPRILGEGSDALTLAPTLKRTRKSLGVDKAIIVSDNGVNSAESLYSVLSGGNGYIVSPSIRSAKQEIKEYILDQQGYTPFGEDCRVKSRIYNREVRFTTPSGKKKNIAFKEKQIVLHNEIFERWARAERQDVLLKAKDLLASLGRYNKTTAYGTAKYTKNSEYDKKTGEILQNRLLYLDEDELKEEEKYDGYYIFLTSELDRSTEDVINTYNGLWEIEEAFKIADNTYRAKPDSLSRTEHMHTHFLTCFVSLALTRILEMKVQKQCPLHRILKSLRKCNYLHIEGNHYLQSYYDSTLDLIGNSMGIDFSKRFGTLQKIKENIGATKKK